MRIFLALFVALFFITCKPSTTNVAEAITADATTISADKAAIKKVLMDQQIAWSDGDIDAFMQGYWKSEELTFIGRSGVNKGWQTTKDNYIKGYPDKATMGILTFEILELELLSADLYRMVGTYALERKEDKPTGIFTLLWRKIDGEWKVIYDHTSG